MLFSFRLGGFLKNFQHRNFSTVLREVFNIWSLITGSFLHMYGFFSLLGSQENVFWNLRHRTNLQKNSPAKINFVSDKATLHTFKMIQISSTTDSPSPPPPQINQSYRIQVANHYCHGAIDDFSEDDLLKYQ